MVNVPVVRNSSVDVAARPVGAVRPRYNPVGEAIGEGLQELGGAGRSYAHQQGEIEEEFDRTQARQMLVDYQAQTTPLMTEFMLKEGVNAQVEAPGLRQRLTQTRQDFAAKATTDRMRRYFNLASQSIETDYSEKIGAHSLGQLKQQQITVAKAEQAQFQSNALLNWSDDKVFSENLSGGLAAVEAEAKVHGVTGVALDVAKRNYVSGTRKSVVNQLLAENRQDDAIGYATVHRGDFNADDMLDVSKVLREPMELRFAISSADKVMGGISAPNTPAGEGVSYSSKSLFDHGIVPIEGGTGKGGKFLTSPKGAIGPAQVMPGTAPEAARLAGLPWDEAKYRSDRDYNLALGRAYYDEMLRLFGDPVKAAAAYNTGPGDAKKGTGLRGAIAKAKARGGSWQDYLPSETKGYISRFSARVGASATYDGIDETEVYGRVDAVAAEEGWTPEQRQAVLSEVDRRVSRSKSLLRSREEDAYDAALTRASDLGDAFTDTAQLGTAFSRMSPQQQVTVKNMAEANRAAKLRAEAPRDGSDTYTSLHNMATLNPTEFMKTDLRAYKPMLTQGNFSTLSQTQARMKAEGVGGKEVSSRAAISSTIAFYSKIDGQGLDPKDDPEDFVRVFDDMNAFLHDVTDGNKRRPTDAELKAAYGRATMQVRQPGALWGWNTKRRYNVEPGTSYSVDIAPETRDRIITRYKERNGGRSPGEDAITQIYVAGKGRPGLW